MPHRIAQALPAMILIHYFAHIRSREDHGSDSNRPAQFFGSESSLYSGAPSNLSGGILQIFSRIRLETVRCRVEANCTGYASKTSATHCPKQVINRAPCAFRTFLALARVSSSFAKHLTPARPARQPVAKSEVVRRFLPAVHQFALRRCPVPQLIRTRPG
jgi:hypothetical protein